MTSLFLLFFAIPAFCWAYIPDVGPGKCVSSPEECADYNPTQSYASGSAYSGSSSSSSSSSSGGYYNSYDAMAMNTAMGLMGSFMDGVMSGMEKAAAQQAEYDRQMAEQQRIEAELARQERERLLAIKKEEQIQLRANYKDKMARSSSAIRAGISRIENMLGMSLSSDSSPLKLETLDDVNPGGIDWDGRQAGAAGASSGGPLELMRDDFVDANVVDLRDKTDLTVRPEVVSAMPAAEPVQAETPDEQATAEPTQAPAEELATESVPSETPAVTGAPRYEAAEPAPVAEVAPEPAAVEQVSAPEPAPVEGQPEQAAEGRPETQPLASGQGQPEQAAEGRPEMQPLATGQGQPEEAAAQSTTVEPLPASEQEELTEHPAAFRQVTPEGSQTLIESPEETAGAEVYSPSIPWRAVPVANSQVDPAVLKGDTPPIRPETVETLKQDRAGMENFNRVSQERVEELRSESQMQEVRKAAEQDWRERAEVWKKKQAAEKEAAAREQADIEKYPGLVQALQDARKEWAEAEKEYNELKAQGKIAPAPENDLTAVLFEMPPAQTWPGPRNPEPPLANPVENDGEHFAGVMKIWRQKREAKIPPAFLPSEKDNESLTRLLIEQLYEENKHKK